MYIWSLKLWALRYFFYSLYKAARFWKASCDQLQYPAAWLLSLSLQCNDCAFYESSLGRRRLWLQQLWEWTEQLRDLKLLRYILENRQNPPSSPSPMLSFVVAYRNGEKWQRMYSLLTLRHFSYINMGKWLILYLFLPLEERYVNEISIMKMDGLWTGRP